MKVLVIGRGAREHALAWKLALSPRVTRVMVAPGNAGVPAGRGYLSDTSAPIENVAVPERDIDALVAFALKEKVDLTVVGPETSLAAGVVDAFQVAGLRCFGPSRAAARIETSKAFAKEFMERHGIPTARHVVLRDYGLARGWLRTNPGPVVIKASGLAAGKGVILPTTQDEALTAIRQIMVDRIFGSAGDEIVIEERLSGPEVSLLAFTDGTHVVAMPPAQDHKAAYDNDRGPNTGGMGAYAPTPLMTPELSDQVLREVLQPAVAGLRKEGMPFVGVLYAGLMLTSNGPRVLEFNARFGDPETEVLLPLLETDLVEVCEACLSGRLGQLEVRWRPEYAATVVMAAQGYPDSFRRGEEINGLPAASLVPGVQIFHAGTLRVDHRLLTDGGRVLAVTGKGATLRSALKHTYKAVEEIHFTGAHYRRDIGGRALSLPVGEEAPASSPEVSPPVVAPPPAAPAPVVAPAGMTYAAAGVDITQGNRAVDLMKAAVKATYGPEVLTGIGAFGGQFDVSRLKQYEAPVLVASTDGVGTKTRVAARLGRMDSVGQDLVNHCVNDILVQGAEPLFFLDYVAMDRLDAEKVAALVGGCALACCQAGCALLGGETAEMPGVYREGEFDLVGTIVGVVDRGRLITGRAIEIGDKVIGLASSGLHTNGYSLARRVFEGEDLTTYVPELGTTLGDALLTVHRSYLAEVRALWRGGVTLHGLVHITGGGLIENPPRVLGPEQALHLDHSRWTVPPLFQLIRRRGRIDPLEMARVFNLGLGMLVVVPAAQAPRAMEILASDLSLALATEVGEITPRSGGPAVTFSGDPW